MTQGLIFSGIQPTGDLHLGNYLGAIRNWARLQQTYDCIFCIVDLHAITVPQDPAALRRAVLETAAAYIAAGIDPERHIIFPQSYVSAHAELAWILSCHTPLGWLNRMTQFKEKAGKHRENAVLGLYSYPVLMAADILLYKATHVPVGEDQKQHLELARDIAAAFNRHYEQEFFPLPEPVITGPATRVMSLRDGRKKMSKSDASPMSRIHLSDSEEEIIQKIRKAKTDSEPSLTYDPENRPEAANLIRIFAAITDQTPEQVCAAFGGKGFAEFKKELADSLAAHLAPIREEMTRLLGAPDYLTAILTKGAQRAQERAEANLNEVKKMVGF